MFKFADSYCRLTINVPSLRNPCEYPHIPYISRN